MKFKFSLPEIRLFRKGRNRTTLQQYLTWVIILSWVIPSIVAVTLISVLISARQHNDVAEMVQASASFAFDRFVSTSASLIDDSSIAEKFPEASLFLAEYQQSGDKEALSQNVNTFLLNLFENNQKVMAAFLYYISDPDTVFFCNKNESCLENYQSYMSAAHKEVVFMAQSIGRRKVFSSFEDNIYLFRQMFNVDRDGSPIFGDPPYAVLVLEIDPLLFLQRSVAWQSEGSFLIGNAAFGDSPETIGMLPKNFGEEKVITLNGKHDFVTASAYIDAEGETIPAAHAVKLNTNAFSGNSDQIIISFLVMVVALFPAVTATTYYFRRKIYSPMKMIIEAYNRLEKGEIGFKIEMNEQYSAEFQLLTKRFNSMSKHLKENIERKAKDERALMEAQMKALQSQINPHFLNNTLEIINWEARFAGCEKVSSMIEALSTILEAAIDRTGNALVPLSEELNYIDAYLYIISQRLGNRLKITKAIDPEVTDIDVPRLCLQPIVENAVEYGSKARGDLEIAISAFREGSAIRILVINTGALSVKDEMRVHMLLGSIPSEEAVRATNVGIRNTNERLRLTYGNGGGLSIYSTGEGRTASEIRIEESALDNLT